MVEHISATTCPDERCYSREMERVERTGDDNQISIMSKKHAFENKFFDYREQQEICKERELFNLPSQYFDSQTKKMVNIPTQEITREPTKQEAKDVHDAFKDYTAEKLGKTWKHTYANGENEIRNVLEKKIDIVEQELTFDFDKKPQINQNIRKNETEIFHVSKKPRKGLPLLFTAILVILGNLHRLNIKMKLNPQWLLHFIIFFYAY